MFDNLKTLLADHQTGMSDYQDDYLVTQRAGGTVYGQYKQALRELYRRLRGLRELICDHDKLAIEIEQLQSRLLDMNDEYDRRLSEVELRRKRARMEESERACRDCAREFVRFKQQAEALKLQVGALTPERRRELEYELYEHKCREYAALDFLSIGQLSTRTVEQINALPDESRNKLNALLLDSGKHDELLTWYQQRHSGERAALAFDDIPLQDAERAIAEVRTKLLEA